MTFISKGDDKNQILINCRKRLLYKLHLVYQVCGPRKFIDDE